MIGDNPNDAAHVENELIGQPIPEVAGTGFQEWEFFLTDYNPDGETYPDESDNPTVYYCVQLKNVTFVEMVGNPALEYDETNIRRFVRNLEESKYIERGSVILGFPKGPRWYTIDKTFGRAWRHYVRLNLDGSQEWWVNLIPEDTNGNVALKAGRIAIVGTDGVTAVTGDTIQRRHTDGGLIWRTQYPPGATDPPERSLIGGAYCADAGAVFAIRTTYNDEFNALAPNPAVPEDEANTYASPRETRSVWLVKIDAATGAEITGERWPKLITAGAYFPLNPIENAPEAGYFDGEWFALACRADRVIVALASRQTARPPINAAIDALIVADASTGADLEYGDLRSASPGFDGFGPWLEVAAGVDASEAADTRFASDPREFLFAFAQASGFDNAREIKRFLLGDVVAGNSSSGYETATGEILDMTIAANTLARFHTQGGGWVTTTSRSRGTNLAANAAFDVGIPEWNLIVRRADIARSHLEPIGIPAKPALTGRIVPQAAAGGNFACWASYPNHDLIIARKDDCANVAAVNFNATHFAGGSTPILPSNGNGEMLTTDGTDFYIRSSWGEKVLKIDGGTGAVIGEGIARTATRFFRSTPIGIVNWGSTLPSTTISVDLIPFPLVPDTPTSINLSIASGVSLTGPADADENYIYAWETLGVSDGRLRRLDATGVIVDGDFFPVTTSGNGVSPGFNATSGIRVAGDYIYCQFVGSPSNALTPALYKLTKAGEIVDYWFSHPNCAGPPSTMGDNWTIDETDGVGLLCDNQHRHRLWSEPLTGNKYIVPILSLVPTSGVEDVAFADPADLTTMITQTNQPAVGAGGNKLNIQHFERFAVLHDDMVFAREWNWLRHLADDPDGSDNINPTEPPFLYSADYDPENDRVYAINGNDPPGFADYNKTVGCFDGTTGEILWQRGYSRPHDVRVVAGKAHVSHRGMPAASPPGETSENTDEPHNTTSDQNEYTGEPPIT